MVGNASGDGNRYGALVTVARAAARVALALPACALLGATSLAALDDDEVVQRLHVRIVPYALRGTSCDRAFASNDEPGKATFRVSFRIADNRFDAPHRYVGTVRFAIDEATITLPSSIAWPGMTDAERAAADELRRAIFHHEVGHVRVAQSVIDALNARGGMSAPDIPSFEAAAESAGQSGLEKFRTAEREYDALTDHGRRQHTAPGELAGPDSAIRCRD